MWIGDSELSRRKREGTSGMFGMFYVLTCVLTAYTKIHRRDFLGSPVAKTLHSAGVTDSIPGQRTKIPQAAQPKKHRVLVTLKILAFVYVKA